VTHKQIVAGSDVRIYRRHSADCDKNPAYLKCDCPLWVQFQRGGKQLRESAKTRDLQVALVLVKKITAELKGEVPVTTKITVKDALDKWLAHREQENIGNQRARGLAKRLLAYCSDHHIVSLASITREHLSDFKLTLNFRSGNSNSLRVALSTIGAFFVWAVEEAGLLTANPFPKFSIRFKPAEVVPPTDEEVTRILAIPRTRLFASLMRFSGMAIRDACTLRRSALVGNLITSNRIKTDKSFRVRIPLWLANELHALPPVNATYFFWNPTKMSAKSASQCFAFLLADSFKEAGVEMTPHKFRHYFISQTLAAGVSVEDVSAMVGTSPNEIRKTYRHWIKAAIDRLDDVQRQAWAAQGLDQDGSPKKVAIQ
jgi:integrase